MKNKEHENYINHKDNFIGFQILEKRNISSNFSAATAENIRKQ